MYRFFEKYRNVFTYFDDWILVKADEEYSENYRDYCQGKKELLILKPICGKKTVVVRAV